VHTFIIDTDNNILQESFVGIVNLNTLTEANTSIISDLRFKKGLNFSTDLRKADLTMNYEEIFRHVSELPDLGINKQAFIVSGDRELAISLMFDFIVKKKGIYKEVRVFKEVEDGLAWLSL